MLVVNSATVPTLVPGVSFRQIDYWARRGYLGPVPMLGSGIPRRWTPNQVAAVAVIARTVEAGVEVKLAARVVEPFLRLPVDEWPETLYIVRGHVRDTPPGGPVPFVTVPVRAIAESTSERLAVSA